MVMVIHETITVKDEPVAVMNATQQIQETLSVLVIEKDRLLSHAPCGNVVEGSGVFNS